MQKIEFTKGKWENSPFTYAYSFRFDQVPQFVQEPDCVVNCKNETAKYGFDNISFLSQETYGPGTRVETCCSFEDLGAPLIVMTDKLYPCEDGVVRYGDYIEVVLYKDGINVWRMYMIDGEVKWNKLMSVEFPVTQSEKHTFGVEIQENVLKIDCEGRKMMLRVDNLPKLMHVGINACEGINRFYSFSVNPINQ